MYFIQFHVFSTFPFVLCLKIALKPICHTISKLVIAHSLIFSKFSKSFDSFTTQCRLLTTLKKKPYEHIVGKGENAGSQYFLIFTQYVFYPFHKDFQYLSYIYFVVCNYAFNLDQFNPFPNKSLFLYISTILVF